MITIGFDALHDEADLRRARVPVVAAGGADATVLQALRIASDRGWVAPIVVGDEASIYRIANEAEVALDDFEVVHAEEAKIAAVSVGCLRSGRAAMLMKGRVETPDLMSAVLDPEFGIRMGRCVAQVVLMEIPRDSRRFLMADTGVMARPKMPKKVEILREAVAVARALGAEVPRVAMMAASEKIIDGLPETFDAAEMQKRAELGEFPGILIEGPLSFDLAYAPSAARKKGIVGGVRGEADVMIFPDLTSANLTVKAIMYTADCRFGGLLRGTTHPVAFMSRADDVPTRLNSLALAIRMLFA